MHVAIVCACLSAGKPFLLKHMPWVIGSSQGTSSAMPMLPTIHSTHTQRLPSRDVGDDPHGDAIHFESSRTGSSGATEGKDDGADNGSLSQIYALFKPDGNEIEEERVRRQGTKGDGGCGPDYKKMWE